MRNLFDKNLDLLFLLILLFWNSDDESNSLQNLADNHVLTMSSYYSNLPVFLKKIMLKGTYFLWKVMLQNANHHQFPRIKILSLWLAQSISLAMEEEIITVFRQQTLPPQQQGMDGKQLHLASYQIMFQLGFWAFYGSPSVISESNIQKDIWQPLSTFTEAHMPLQNMLEALPSLDSFIESCVLT